MVGEIRESSEEILVMSKHLEDMLKELFFEAENVKSEAILNLHKRMYKKVRDIKRKVVQANTKVSELSGELSEMNFNSSHANSMTPSRLQSEQFAWNPLVSSEEKDTRNSEKLYSNYATTMEH